MNRKVLLFIVIFGFVALSIPRTQTLSAKPYNSTSSPLCVKCAIQNACRSCVGGVAGGFYCYTFNCGACLESGECPSPGGVGGFLGDQSPGIDIQSNPKFYIDAKVIKSIATKHPRFAATIANLNYANVSSQLYTMYWTPVEILSSDIDAFLNREKNQAYFKKFEEKSHRLNQFIQTGQLAEIVYQIKIETPDLYTQKIKIQVVNEQISASVDPPYSSLEITSTHTRNRAGALVKTVNTAWQWTLTP